MVIRSTMCSWLLQYKGAYTILSCSVDDAAALCQVLFCALFDTTISLSVYSQNRHSPFKLARFARYEGYKVITLSSQISTMNVTTLTHMVNTNQEPLGTIVLQAGRLADAADSRERHCPHARTDVTEIDPMAVRPQQIVSRLLDEDRPTTMPLMSTSVLDEQFEEVLYPPIPVPPARASTPTSSRVPPRTTRARSLPLMTPRPLSDGPMAYTYMPVSARSGRFESLGPIERFPRPRNMDSMVSYVVTICESEEAAHERTASQIFRYTPDADYAITHVKKVRWYAKGAAKVKKMMKEKIRK